jgi:GH35 family endo-1,4-beta-xylanase
MMYDLSLPSLRKVFEGCFLMGNIISPRDFKDEATMAMYCHHYNAVTAENAMKPVYISPSEGVYKFDEADKIADWAERSGIKLIGHTFVWHGQSAQWLNRHPDDTPLPRAQAKANLEQFIKAYAGRYSGRIYSWDVMNEVFRDDNEWKGNWREHLRRETDNPRAVGHWFLAYQNGAEDGESGADYVFDAYYYARKYDPAAKLYYNEYNEEYPVKREAIANMTEEVNEMWKAHAEYDGRLLIEGIGMQSHYNHKTDFGKVRDSIERFIKTGAVISATELDITFGASDAPASPLTAEQSNTQAEMYGKLFAMYREYSAHIERVTFWAKNDGESWRKWGSPVLFDGDGAAKEAFWAVVK